MLVGVIWLGFCVVYEREYRLAVGLVLGLVHQVVVQVVLVVVVGSLLLPVIVALLYRKHQDGQERERGWK